MTHLNYPNFDDMFKGADKFLVGYDKIFDRLAELQDQIPSGTPNYPPYNIYKSDDDEYIIEMAVAGFSESEVDITLDGDKLTVTGSVDRDHRERESVLYRGLAFRDFARTFTLNNDVVVRAAEMENGLLKIRLEHVVPESQKPKKIEINSGTQNTLLNG